MMSGLNIMYCNEICSCESVDVNPHPLDYYIYTLEKIVT